MWRAREKIDLMIWKFDDLTMNNRIQFFLLLIFCFSSEFLIAQNTIQNSGREFGADTIQWKENSSLKYSDFKSKPYGSFQGNTYAGITLDFTQDEKGIHLFLFTIFFCKHSFLKDTSINLLNHEQLHFDITEIYKRKLLQQLSQKDFSKEKNSSAVIQKIYNQVNEEMNKEQDRYDKETNHGIISAKQNQWIDSVRAQLKALSNFQGNDILIK